MELLIVMIIIAILFSLSLFALVGFGESSKLNRFVSDFASRANTDLSNARNNVYDQSEIQKVLRFNDDITCSSIGSSDFAPAAIGYTFENNQYSPIKCLATQFSATANYCCVKTDLKDGRLEYTDENILISASCKSILFEYSTGDIMTSKSGQYSTMLANEDDCVVTIRHGRLGFSKEILFNAKNNAIEIQQ